MLGDHHEYPPLECELCGVYRAFKDGICWQCLQKILTEQLKPAKLVELPLENSNDSN